MLHIPPLAEIDGVDAALAKRLLDFGRRPSGLVVVTGGTACGKTTFATALVKRWTEAYGGRLGISQQPLEHFAVGEHIDGGEVAEIRSSDVGLHHSGSSPSEFALFDNQNHPTSTWLMDEFASSNLRPTVVVCHQADLMHAAGMIEASTPTTISGGRDAGQFRIAMAKAADLIVTLGPLGEPASREVRCETFNEWLTRWRS